ncbi:MAG: metallophosphoesterase [Chloroflexi bacterium]|nr:metallophosphoesterase [Chloroflexota bacterium]
MSQPTPPPEATSNTLRPDPAMLDSPLEQRALHKFLLLTNLPLTWNAWQIIGFIAGLLAVTAALWWALVDGSSALDVLQALAFFVLADALILASLPLLRLSFGPVGAQLVLLAAPRCLAAILAIALARWLGADWTVAILLALELAALAAVAWGAYGESWRIQLTEMPLALGGATDAPPLRLLHLSDLHVERYGRREERLLRLVREAEPDLILITGDYVSLSCVDDPLAHADARRVLGQIAAPRGVYAVLGSPPVDRNSAQMFEGLDIRLLRNEAVAVDIGWGQRIALLGLDCLQDPPRDAEHLREVSAQAAPGLRRVLLFHSPELALAAPEAAIDLYLCGHTHGGQIRLPFYGAMITSSTLGKRFEMGYYRVGQTHLYVSRGIGLEGMGAPRLRFLCPPEVTLFTLTGL